MEAKRVISVRYAYQNPEDHQDSGAIIQFMPPSRSSIQGTNQKSRTSPSNLGRSLSFLFLDHPQWIQAIWTKITLIWALGPPVIPEHLGPGARFFLGDSNSPHKAYGPWAIRTKNLRNSKFAIDVVGTQIDT
ncbi:hypothetical protein O181_079070 [Austropuccinia psidii MF-1]|uniref:Uncharacterized protein n=1 Tax=Austropuccinia psidii MF-1 TaxID=1389203 RepID=A0A9Q3FE34_9BASI|nr:hypothetical protein [Austropuccinia psidii MF-1]